MITAKQKTDADRYINKQLSSIEKKAFQNILQENADLKLYVEFLEDVEWSIKQRTMNQDRQLIQSFEKDYQQQKRFKKIALISVCFMSLLIGLYFVNKQLSHPKEPDIIYAALYEQDQTPIGTAQIRGEEIPTIDTMLAFALHYLDNGQKKEAIGVLSTLAATNPTRIEYVYYYALALFKNEKYEEAYQQFTRNAALWEGTPYDIQAKYYAAGCSLKLGRYQEALTNYQLVEKNIDSPWSGRVKEQQVVARLMECCASNL